MGRWEIMGTGSEGLQSHPSLDIIQPRHPALISSFLEHCPREMRTPTSAEQENLLCDHAALAMVYASGDSTRTGPFCAFAETTQIEYIFQGVFLLHICDAPKNQKWRRFSNGFADFVCGVQRPTAVWTATIFYYFFFENQFGPKKNLKPHD